MFGFDATKVSYFLLFIRLRWIPAHSDETLNIHHRLQCTAIGHLIERGQHIFMKFFPFGVWQMSSHPLKSLHSFRFFRLFCILIFFIFSRFFIGIVCIQIICQCIVMLQFDVAAPEVLRFSLYHFIVFLQFLLCIVNFNGCERQFHRQLMTSFTFTSRGFRGSTRKHANKKENYF